MVIGSVASIYRRLQVHSLSAQSPAAGDPVDTVSLGQQALAYVQSLDLTSTTRGYLPSEAQKEADARLTQVRQAASTGTTAWEAIQRSAAAAEEHRAGNCGEMADLAYRELKNRGVDNLASVTAESRNRFYGIPKANHGFVVAGLAPDADLARPETWGDQAIVVDPFHDFCGPAEEGLAKVRAYMERCGCEQFSLQDSVVKGRGEQDELAWNNLRTRL
ncbi:MAG: hypothetical protein KC910_03920 [Candidatus Eremiobacteraeota bacterium]|nr:hypothetical protein [Candidatus Eremiobacteraeota bacterium]